MVKLPSLTVGYNPIVALDAARVPANDAALRWNAWRFVMSDRFLARETRRAACDAFAHLCALAITSMALGVLAAPSLAAEAPKSADDPYPQDILPDSAGGNLSLPAARGQVATVLVCMSIECPISNEYTPTLNRLAEKFLPSGVSFIGINPNSGQTLREMADHARQFKIAFPFVKDAGAKVSRRLLFQVTPEVCVFDRGGKLAYRGRIDDRYRARGGAAGAVATADLERALRFYLGVLGFEITQRFGNGAVFLSSFPQARVVSMGRRNTRSTSTWRSLRS